MSNVWYFPQEKRVLDTPQRTLFQLIFYTIAGGCVFTSAWAVELICVSPGSHPVFYLRCEHNGYQKNILTEAQEKI